MMPWPSATYMVEDSASETGFRLDVPIEAMPVNTNDVAIDPASINRWDGFSPSGPIIASFPTGVSADGLPGHSDIGASLDADSPIVLLNMDTGDRAAFFAEVDMNAEELAHRTLIIRPTKRLDPGSRYVVAIRDTVHGAGGEALDVPPAFDAIREGKSFSHPRFAALAARYDDIFAALDAEGVSQDELVLAWDFVTASDEFLTSDLLAMREDALEAMGPDGENLTFEAQEFPGTNARVHKLITGEVDSPDFLTNEERDDSILRRDASGRPDMDGMRPANFTAIIPKCVETAPLPVPVMVFGHGLFGSGEGYLNDNLLQQVSQDYCFVVIAGDWIGLTERQIGVAALAVNDLNKGAGITEKLAQAVIDFISIEHAIRGPMHDSPVFQYMGTPVVDPTQVYYFGASLGGIMGSSFMAYDQVVTRGVLSVPGGPWSMLFERSLAWNALQGPAQASYPDPANFQILISLLGMAFEPYDPITAAPHLLQDPLPDTPVKQILVIEAIHDSLVANVATETLARTIGLPVIMPSLKEPYGLTGVSGVSPNGLSIYDEDVEPVPPEFNTPPEDDNGTHSGVHERPAVLREIEAFLYDGEVANQCEVGQTVVECDCATGACD